MIKVLENAIDKVKRLPEDRQAYVAEVLEQIAAAGTASLLCLTIIALQSLRALSRPSVVSS
jgi:hypothetical protein